MIHIHLAVWSSGLQLDTVQESLTGILSMNCVLQLNNTPELFLWIVCNCVLSLFFQHQHISSNLKKNILAKAFLHVSFTCFPHPPSSYNHFVEKWEGHHCCITHHKCHPWRSYTILILAKTWRYTIWKEF